MIIYKYPLKLTSEQNVAMPRGSKILDIQKQRDQLIVWAIVNIEKPLCHRRILIWGTGQPDADLSLEAASWYLTTVQMGDYVWHFFDGGEV